VLRVQVSDDGAGFDPKTEHPGHLGLGTMAERAQAIGADLAITSAPGDGTTVALSLRDGWRENGEVGPDVL
jgi:signal transduction histidine kinase